MLQETTSLDFASAHGLRGPYIDPSLARGIRRGYLEALDKAWGQWCAGLHVWRSRTPMIDVPTVKAFDKRCDKEETLARRFLPVDGLTVSAGKRKLWASLSLQRERLPASKGESGMSSAGIGRVVARVLTFPKGADFQELDIRFTAHAIDRLIQRTRLVSLPLSRNDIEAIHASFAGSLIWACAALNVLACEGDQVDDEDCCIALPVDLGVFIAKRDAEFGGLAIMTFIPNDRLWDEERYALRRLRRIGDDGAAILAAAALSPILFGAAGSAEVRAQILQIWRELRWLVREKVDRPSAMDAAWAQAGG